jgi:hypothetical protein
MLTVLVVAGLVLVVAGLALFVALCLAIRREDRSPRLTSQPPTAGTAMTRRIAGLSVRRAASPARANRSEPRPALWPARYRSESDHEGR